MKRFFVPLFLCFLISLFCVPASAQDNKTGEPHAVVAQDEGAGFSPGAWLISFSVIGAEMEYIWRLAWLTPRCSMQRCKCIKTAPASAAPATESLALCMGRSVR